MGVFLGGRGTASRCAAALLVALLTTMPVRSQDGGYSTDAAKAAFLYHFGTYVQWPRSPAGGAPIAIAVLGAEHNAYLETLIEHVRDRPVLTVSDAPDGLERGAMVNFQLVGERVRFEVSLAAAQRAGLVLSSRLLASALRVETSGCRIGCEPEAPDPFELAAVARV
ncbi:MAG TPA: YfiR family protein [Gammaproteobacteria bacterium]